MAHTSGAIIMWPVLVEYGLDTKEISATQGNLMNCTFYTHTHSYTQTYQGSVLSSAVRISCGACYAYKILRGVEANLVVVEKKTENAVCCELVNLWTRRRPRSVTFSFPTFWILLLPICCLCTSLTHNPSLPLPDAYSTLSCVHVCIYALWFVYKCIYSLAVSSSSYIRIVLDTRWVFVIPLKGWVKSYVTPV